MSLKIANFTQAAGSALLLASALALSGCVSDAFFEGDADHIPTHASDKYPITLAKGPQTIEIASSQGHLSDEQANAVKGFVHQAAQAGVTPMTVSRPSGGGASARVASEIASVMLSQGVPRNRVIFTSYPGPASGPVRISFVSVYAQTKPCGDWSEDLTATYSNSSYPNLGCAVQANIAAEIANPETLVVPLPEDLKPAPSTVLAITNEAASVNAVTLPTNYKYTSAP
ncbi:MAG: CpaD family pilus assembly protein [Alphaproteobacteria bacterium]|nr:CpaD family pilus assembly protein [Alphaproteobacteria bacterium]